MSARKSLLGKLTSVAQQQARKIVDRSARQREGRAERMERRTQKRKMEEEKEEDEEESDSSVEKVSPKLRRRSVNNERAARKSREEYKTKRNRSGEKKNMRSPEGINKVKRSQTMKRMGKKKMLNRIDRSINRNKSIGESPRLSRSSLDTPSNMSSLDTPGGRTRSKSKEDGEDCRDGESESPTPPKRRKGKRQVGAGREARASSKEVTPRKPYKVRPIERVRTRGYSLMLASRQALRKAHRDQGKARVGAEADKKKTEVNTEAIGGSKNLEGVSKDKNGEEKLSKMETSGRRQGSTGDDAAGARERTVEKRNFSLGLPLEEGKDSIKKKLAESESSSSSRRSSRETTISTSSSQSYKRASTSSSKSNYEDYTAAVPTFHPTEEEFADPMTYIAKIQRLAEAHGMAKIAPPSSWKLESNKVDEIRFTSQVQHIHRLYQRWGPCVQQSAAINQHLLSGHSNINTSPQIAGVEVDLPLLYKLVENAGGPKKLAEKKQWTKIADQMVIPKQAMDRTVRLYDIYCRHVFPYASLSEEERQELDSETEGIHQLQAVEDNAINKGRSMTLSRFSHFARNVQAVWFKDDPTPHQVETMYWRLVEDRVRNVSVQCGHINTQAQASAFPARKDSPYSRHPWNLNKITSNPNCLLKYIGQVARVTIPTLHASMLFSTSCWSNSPNKLPYVQYHHFGAPTIWYCVSRDQDSKLQSAMMELTPKLVSDKPSWLKEDTVMVNPRLLHEHGIRVSRCVQQAQEFVVIFPGAFTSTVACGYNISESVHFALPDWLFNVQVSNRCDEKELFPMSRLLFLLIGDSAISQATLSQALPLATALIQKELDLRNQFLMITQNGSEQDTSLETGTQTVGSSSSSSTKRRSSMSDDKVFAEEKVCDVCHKICYLSVVINEIGDHIYCLEHGLKHVQNKKNVKSTNLFKRFTQTELNARLKYARSRLDHQPLPDSSSQSSAENNSGSSSSTSLSTSNLSTSSSSSSNSGSGSKMTRTTSRQSVSASSNNTSLS